MIGKSPCQPDVFECPPEDFNPLDASSDTLLRFGFPLRPGAEILPALDAFWFRMFSPPLKFGLGIPVAFKAGGLLASRRSATANQRNARLFSTRRQSSQNWSGAYIKPRNGKAFTEIHAEYRVPSVEPSLPPAISFPEREYRCSTWIGLDGQRRYFHSSLPQIGTTQSFPSDNSGGVNAEYFAWLQWWDRHGIPQPYEKLEGLNINAGNLIMCSMWVESPTSVKFMLKNQNTGDVFGPEIRHAPIKDIGGTNVQYRVSGATAEWITERPSEWPTDLQYNFPDYGHVNFEDCIAVMREPNGFEPEERNLLGARLIDMREVRYSPQRTAKISVTGRPTEHAFQTTYQTS